MVSWGRVVGDFGTVVAYFSWRFSTNLFRGVTDAMGTEGAVECGALDFALRCRVSGDVSMLEVEDSHIQKANSSDKFFVPQTNSPDLTWILCYALDLT